MPSARTSHSRSGRGSAGLSRGERLQRVFEAIRRAFAEFLTIPTLVIVGFLLLGAFLYYLDRLRIERGWSSFVPSTHESVSTLLGTIATSIITMTSITLSLLLIAVQQSAAALTGQVYDQFLRRGANQFYFGFFLGLALYSLIILATIHPDYTPVYSALAAFLLTVIALFLLILLIYSTIDQMRPVMIVQTIRDHTLLARELQREKLLSRTRRAPCCGGEGSVRVPSRENGYLTAVRLDALCTSLRERLGAREAVLLRSIGDYVSRGEDLVELRFDGANPTGNVDDVLGSFELEQQRDLGADPAFGIEQLVTIGWTSVSSSKQNPAPGLLACFSLRDMAANWFDRSVGEDESAERVEDERLPIVYFDNVPRELIRAFESLIVVASESMQHQVVAEVYRALALAVPRLPADRRAEVEAVVQRSLSALGDHVLTDRLDDAIGGLAEALEKAGLSPLALRRARDRLAASVGALNSRATRVPKQ